VGQRDVEEVITGEALSSPLFDIRSERTDEQLIPSTAMSLDRLFDINRAPVPVIDVKRRRVAR
jgi:hypothetical protein